MLSLYHIISRMPSFCFDCVLCGSFRGFVGGGSNCAASEKSGMRVFWNAGALAGKLVIKNMRDPDKLALRSEAYADFLSGMNSSAVQTEYEVLHLMRQCTAQFGFSHFMIAHSLRRAAALCRASRFEQLAIGACTGI
ncbi:hypothetical protein LP421_25055 [Rhizobium sp. RCAM05350]|nr:hypothetical protein LP421_25055 [Rhizobium sp. RCAM05350]